MAKAVAQRELYFGSLSGSFGEPACYAAGQSPCGLKRQVKTMGIILLDIGNVMVRVDFDAFSSAVAVPGDGVSHEIFNRYCTGSLKSQLDRGLLDPAVFIDRMAEDPLVRPMPRQELVRAWQEIFFPLEGAQEGVRALEQEHRHWIMSDTDPLHFDSLLRTVPHLANHERYYLSFRHGSLKSSNEAFRHVLTDSGVHPDQLLLIDDRQENCDSAAHEGIGSVLFSSWPETLLAVQNFSPSRP
ncbi:haloacid dehalogenase [Chlorobium phaeovibrioides]|nr:haloacid dehalogenase [Chlorobium phaeovibrioides]